MKLEGKGAIITGGSKGIGLGCAKIFAKYGCKVVIAARGEEEGEKVAGELRAAGPEALFVKCDVSSEADMRRLIDTTVEHFGQIDSIINNAGWHPPSLKIEDISTEDFESLLRLNLTSTFLGCKLALPHLKKTKGSIVNMSSEVAVIGQANAVSYVATKAGQIGITRALALDVAIEGVRVNAVCPAGVMTPLMVEWAATEYDKDAALKMVHDYHARGKMGTIEEIGEICAFLASDESSFVTGQVLCADGGAALGYGKKTPD